jgi:hypothetical protein
MKYILLIRLIEIRSSPPTPAGNWLNYVTRLTGGRVTSTRINKQLWKIKFEPIIHELMDVSGDRPVMSSLIL